MAYIDELWNPENEKPLAIAISPNGNESTIVMTTSCGRVLIRNGSDTAGHWRDITPKIVRRKES